MARSSLTSMHSSVDESYFKFGTFRLRTAGPTGSNDGELDSDDAGWVVLDTMVLFLCFYPFLFCRLHRCHAMLVPITMTHKEEHLGVYRPSSA
jgi:hypothetical protein